MTCGPSGILVGPVQAALPRLVGLVKSVLLQVAVVQNSSLGSAKSDPACWPWFATSPNPCSHPIGRRRSPFRKRGNTT
jgi:hypothetical protein